jgi:hypothetical protein
MGDRQRGCCKTTRLGGRLRAANPQVAMRRMPGAPCFDSDTRPARFFITADVLSTIRGVDCRRRRGPTQMGFRYTKWPWDSNPAEGNSSGARLPPPLPHPSGPGEPVLGGVAARPVFCSPGIPLRLRSHPADLPSARLAKTAVWRARPKTKLAGRLAAGLETTTDNLTIPGVSCATAPQREQLFN